MADNLEQRTESKITLQKVVNSGVEIAGFLTGYGAAWAPYIYGYSQDIGDNFLYKLALPLVFISSFFTGAAGMYVGAHINDNFINSKFFDSND